MSDQREHANGALSARPDHPGHRDARTGTFALGLGGRRDGMVHIPDSPLMKPAPLLIMLHGAGADAGNIMPIVAKAADTHGIVVLAPDSRGPSWDLVHGGYGPDVAFLDEALGYLFSRWGIDPRRMAIAGFSDGGSYALSLGVANGEMFSDILAFSPGFIAPRSTKEQPRVFISHGRLDRVLPIERCGRRVAAKLSADGYDVDYREFGGGHLVPADMVDAAFQRFLR